MTLLDLWASFVFWRGQRAGRRGQPIGSMPYAPGDWRVRYWITGWLRARCPALFDPSLYFREREL